MIERLDDEESWTLVVQTPEDKQLAKRFSDEKAKYLLAKSRSPEKRACAESFLNIMEEARATGVLRASQPKDLRLENTKLKTELNWLRIQLRDADKKYDVLDKINRGRFQSDVQAV
jgi:hypothetical protein